VGKARAREWVLSGFLAALLVLSGLGLNAYAAGTGENARGHGTLLAYVGGQLKDPFEQLAAMYQEKTGVEIQVIFNNCGFLLGQVQTTRRGDVFIAGSTIFVKKARQKGAVAEVSPPLAYHVPVIVTPKGNPAGIAGVRDLARPGVRLLMPDPRATAIGMDAVKTFDKLGIAAGVRKNTIACLATPSQALAAMLMGQGNAAVVSYNAILRAEGKIHVVRIDPKVNMVGTVHCVVLSFSKHLNQAKDFSAFLAENGPRVFTAYGFRTRL